VYSAKNTTKAFSPNMELLQVIYLHRAHNEGPEDGR